MGLCAPSATRRKDGMSCIYCPIHITYELNVKRNAIFKLRWPTQCAPWAQTSDSESVKSYKFTEPDDGKKADRMKRSRRKMCTNYLLFRFGYRWICRKSIYFLFCSNFWILSKRSKFVFSSVLFYINFFFIYIESFLYVKENQSFLFHSLCRIFFSSFH